MGAKQLAGTKGARGMRSQEGAVASRPWSSACRCISTVSISYIENVSNYNLKITHGQGEGTDEHKLSVIQCGWEIGHHERTH